MYYCLPDLFWGKIKILFVLIFLVCSMVCSGQAVSDTSEKKPIIEKSSYLEDLDLGTFKFDGWFARKLSFGAGRSKSFLSHARFNLSWKHDNGFDFYGTVDLATLQNKNADWLKVARLAYTKNGHTFRFGRFTIAGTRPTPAPQNLITVRYSRVPTYTWGTGVQYSTRFGQGWSFVGDITGLSGTVWNDSRQFDKVQTSFRVKKKFRRYNSFLAGTVLISPKVKHFVIDGSFSPSEKWDLSGAIYYKHSYDDYAYGVCGLGVYKHTDSLSFHNQIDVQKKKDHGLNAIFTSGLSYSRKFYGQEFLVIIDKEFYTNNRMKGPVFVKLQYRF